jgi:hypothetical protein
MSNFTSRRAFPARSLAIAFAVTPLMTLMALAAVGTPPSVIALNQKTKGNDVSITYAFLPKQGELAIYSSDSSGRIGKTPIGRVALAAGDHRVVRVALSPSPKAGARLWAVVEPKGGTQPFKRLSGKPAEETFKTL